MEFGICFVYILIASISEYLSLEFTQESLKSRCIIGIWYLPYLLILLGSEDLSLVITIVLEDYKSLDS